MKLIEVEKEYSWLQWPVRLKNCERELHITAKFFGHADINEAEVERLLREGCDETLDLSGKAYRPYFTWRPEVFNELTHVLVLTGTPFQVRHVHGLFNLIADQFVPYRPHITVPKAYWQSVVNLGWTPMSEEIEVGELELCQGTK